MEQFENTFPAHTYVTTSNYGHGFKDGVPEDDKIRPFQREVPFLWTLAVLGYLDVYEKKSSRIPLFGSTWKMDRAGKDEKNPDEMNRTWRNLCMVEDVYIQER